MIITVGCVKVKQVLPVIYCGNALLSLPYGDE